MVPAKKLLAFIVTAAAFTVVMLAVLLVPARLDSAAPSRVDSAAALEQGPPPTPIPALASVEEVVKYLEEYLGRSVKVEWSGLDERKDGGKLGVQFTLEPRDPMFYARCTHPAAAVSELPCSFEGPYYPTPRFRFADPAPVADR